MSALTLTLTLKQHYNKKKGHFDPDPDPRGGTLGISGWGCAAGTLEPLTYTRASSAEFATLY